MTGHRSFNELRAARSAERQVRSSIPVEEAAKEWRKNPEFVAAYDALEEEFSLAEARIKVRAAESQR